VPRTSMAAPRRHDEPAVYLATECPRRKSITSATALEMRSAGWDRGRAGTGSRPGTSRGTRERRHLPHREDRARSSAGGTEGLGSRGSAAHRLQILRPEHLRERSGSVSAIRA
jgi:hypothetical protein